MLTYLLVFWISFTPAAQADFTADVTMTHASGAMTGKMFHKGNKSRMDMNTPAHEGAGAGKISIISDEGTQQKLMIMHAQRMYTKMDASRRPPVDAPECTAGAGAEGCFAKHGFRAAGAETIDGTACKIFEKSNPGQPPDVPAYTMRLWIPSGGQEAPVRRMITKRNDTGAEMSRMETSHLTHESVPDSTFAPPADYRNMQAAGAPGGMPAMPTAAEMEGKTPAEMRAMMMEKMKNAYDPERASGKYKARSKR